MELKDWTKIDDEAVELLRRYPRVGFTGNWVCRRCGLHGNDERISVENLTAGVRCSTEMLLDMAAA